MDDLRPIENNEGILLNAELITKKFGDLVANDRVSLTLAKGEIHALLGENGAGKSTFVKMLYGSLQPDSGRISWKGKQVHIKKPIQARALGIGMVFQHFSLFEALTVEENIALALPRKQRKRLAGRITDISAEYGLPLDPTATVADLSVGERQRIEIVRCLLQEPDLIIMDEPTSVLTPQEADELFVVLEKLAAEGRAILYISHRLDEVQRLCHRATILRHGKLIAECKPHEETAMSLATMMVGSSISQVKREGSNAAGTGKIRLKLNMLSAPSPSGLGISLRDISLQVYGGEVVCIAGIAGNGQAELFSVLSGEQTVKNAAYIELNDIPIGRKSIGLRRRMGAAFVPEERNGHAALPELKLSENLLLSCNLPRDGTVSSGVINRRALAWKAGSLSAEYDVRMAHADPEAGSLSGGNLQKFSVGRELSKLPGVLVVSQPTWGVDAGAASLIRQKILDLSRLGAAVLVISQDLDEIYEIADRVTVISEGELSAVYKIEDISREEIGILMGGIALSDAATKEAEYAA